MPDESEDATGSTIDQPGIIVPKNLVQLFQQDVHQDCESRIDASRFSMSAHEGHF